MHALPPHHHPPALRAPVRRAPSASPLLVDGIFDAAGVKVTTAAGGQPLSITGTGLGTPGFVYFKPAGMSRIVQWTDTKIDFIVPSLPAGVQSQTNWVEIRRSGDTGATILTQNFLVTAGSPLPPPAPKVGFLQMEVPTGSPLSARVTLSAPALADTVVFLTYVPPIVGAPQSVTVRAGSTWASFLFPPLSSTSVPVTQEIDASSGGATQRLVWWWVPNANPLPPPPPLDGPKVVGYSDANMVPITAAHPISDELVIQGTNFGTTIGTVRYDGLACAVTHWEVEKIIVILPVSNMVSGPPPESGFITVTRADGQYTSSGPVYRVVPAVPPAAVR